MTDDRAEQSKPAPDSGRARRAPPTIDLEATEVTGASADSDAAAEPKRSRWRAVIFVASIAGICGAAVVIAATEYAGLLDTSSTAPANKQNDETVLENLAGRVGRLETRAGRPEPAAPDPALSARIDALEKSLAALRFELGALSAQSEKFAASVNEAKSNPNASSASSPDLAAINERLDAVERTTRAQVSEVTQEATKMSQEAAKAADDVPLRRLVAASLLDTSVRTGEAYAAALDAAKSLAEKPDALRPLEGFAASGVPSAAALSRELLAQISKLSPPAREQSAPDATDGSIIDRLKANAAKLVRIERTDSGGNDAHGAIGRVTTAALRNDYAEARRELKALPAADRAPMQAWIDKADARDAALAASRQFATDAMAALGKPRQ